MAFETAGALGLLGLFGVAALAASRQDTCVPWHPPCAVGSQLPAPAPGPDPGPPPDPGSQPEPPVAFWALGFDDMYNGVFYSNTPVMVQFSTAAFTTNRETGSVSRLTGWTQQGPTTDPTSGYVIGPDYSAYLALAQMRDDVWGVMLIAQLYDQNGTLLASGNPDAEPFDDKLQAFVTITELQQVFATV